MDDSYVTKETLRKGARSRLRSLSGDTLASASRAITDAFLSSPLFAACSTLFCYIGIPGEPDTARLIAAALGSGKKVCVPRCINKGEMEAVPVRDLSSLTDTGSFGIPQPCSRIAAIDPGEIDLVIVPCLAAGTGGERLGHGAGYYDRFLAGCPGTTVCLCFDALLTDGIPMAPHDVFMDHIVTEKGWYHKEGDA